jgi:hypothetical protein
MSFTAVCAVAALACAAGGLVLVSAVFLVADLASKTFEI